MERTENRKKVLSAALVCGLVAILGVGSLAYYQAQKSVLNRFTTEGTEDVVEISDFSIALYEEGQFGDSTVITTTGLQFTGVAEGDVLVKKPYVTNTSVEDLSAWLRATVTISNVDNLLKEFGQTNLGSETEEGKTNADFVAALLKGSGADWALDSNSIVYASGEAGAPSTLTFEYYSATAALAQNATSGYLFESVNIPDSSGLAAAGEIDSADSYEFEMTIVVDAIDGSAGDTAAAAFDNWDDAQI